MKLHSSKALSSYAGGMAQGTTLGDCTDCTAALQARLEDSRSFKYSLKDAEPKQLYLASGTHHQDYEIHVLDCQRGSNVKSPFLRSRSELVYSRSLFAIRMQVSRGQLRLNLYLHCRPYTGD